MLDQIVTYKSLVIVIAIVMIPIIAFMAEADTFWGLIGIALSILALGIPYFLVYWRRTTRFEEMADFLKRLMLVQIDEKVAVMDGYISEIPDWKKDGKSPDYVNAITDKINSDLKSVYRIKNEINQDQIIELKYRGKKLVNLMRNEQYDTSRIEAVLELFD